MVQEKESTCFVATENLQLPIPGFNTRQKLAERSWEMGTWEQDPGSLEQFLTFTPL